jgi:hypothetical protein
MRPSAVKDIMGWWVECPESGGAFRQSIGQSLRLARVFTDGIRLLQNKFALAGG